MESGCTPVTEKQPNGMRIALAEDEPLQRAYLRELIEDYARERATPVHVTEFESGDALLAGYEQGTQLLLLDIDMPGTNGMDAARAIRTRDANVMIIFCTNLVSRALDGYAVEALDFIVKPVGRQRLFEAVDKAVRYIRARMPRMLTLHTQDGIINVREEDVYYAETYGRKLRIHTAQGVHELRMTIVALEQALRPGTFFRVHNACLVALRYVQRLSGLEVTVAGDVLPVSRHKKREFVEQLATFMGEQL